MNRQTGVSLMELMVVIAILAILLTVGLPTYRDITNSYRLSAEANGLLGDLMYAREEALKEGQFVTVCVSSNGTTCSGAATWQNGWIIYSNPANNNAPVVGSVLRVQAAFTGSVPDTFVPSSGISEVTYNREGFATTAAGFPNTLFTLHDQTANKLYTRCLWLTPIGLASIQTNLNNFSGMLCQ
jgi:type IV fimbrial biogenesis protein FimT